MTAAKKTPARNPKAKPTQMPNPPRALREPGDVKQIAERVVH